VLESQPVPHRREVLEGLVVLYESTGRSDVAAQYRAILGTL
jgi:hypothetical protein